MEGSGDGILCGFVGSDCKLVRVQLGRMLSSFQSRSGGAVLSFVVSSSRDWKASFLALDNA